MNNWRFRKKGPNTYEVFAATDYVGIVQREIGGTKWIAYTPAEHGAYWSREGAARGLFLRFSQEKEGLL